MSEATVIGDRIRIHKVIEARRISQAEPDRIDDIAREAEGAIYELMAKANEGGRRLPDGAILLRMDIQPHVEPAPLIEEKKPEHRLVRKASLGHELGKALDRAVALRRQMNLMVQQIGACQTRMQEIQAEAPVEHDNVFSGIARTLGYADLADLRAKGFELGVDPKERTYTLLEVVK